MAHSLPVLIFKACLLICSLYSLYNFAYSEIIDALNPTIYCDETTNASKSYMNNVNLLFSDFISQSTKKHFYNTTIGNTLDKVFGYYMCRGDVKPQACRSCLIDSQNLDCQDQHFIIMNSRCSLQYTNHSMYGVWNETMTATSPLWVKGSNYVQDNQTVLLTMQDLINEVASANVNDTKTSEFGFATKVANVTGDEKLYTLAQCTPDILGVNCSKCLTNLLTGVPQAYYKYQGVGAVEPKCLIRFYYQSLIDPGVAKPSKGEVLRPSNLVAIFSALALFIYYSYVG